MGINKTTSEQYLAKLSGMNLYSPQNVYSIDTNKLTNTISDIVSFASNNTIEFKNSLASTVLGGGTPLQQIGDQELAKAFANRVSDNIRTEKLPTVSIGSFFDVNINQPLSYWKITPDESTNTLSSILKTITGYESVSNPVPSGNNDKWLKDHAGEGQKQAYNSNISTNKYTEDGMVYGKDTLSRQELVNGNPAESLLYKSNLLINSNNVDENGYPTFTLHTPMSNDDFTTEFPFQVGLSGDKINPHAVAFKQLNSDGKIEIISKGSGVYTDNAGTKFLRVFNVDNQYNSTSKLMKYNHDHSRLDGNSTLQTVFPKVFPKSKDDYKNLMFSITNLAMNNRETMWFVPYNLKLSEDVTANWNKVSFIGRNEPMYTYNGTDRNCNISFTLIADYPAELDNITKWGSSATTDNDFDKFFRQDNVLAKPIKNNKEATDIATAVATAPTPAKSVDFGTNDYDVSNALKYYFDNNEYLMKDTLTTDNAVGTGDLGIKDFEDTLPELIQFLNTEVGKRYRVVIEGRSSSLYTSDYNKMLSYKRAYEVYKVISNGIEDAKKYKLAEFNEPLDTTKQLGVNNLTNERFMLKPSGEKSANKDASIETINRDIVDRFCAVYLEPNPNLVQVDNTKLTDNTQKTITTQDNTLSEGTIGDFYFTRYDANTKLLGFNEEELTNNLINTYSNNIKYFNPAYHSQTPVDLNKRVTFLHQCTRQGNSVKTNGTTSGSINSDDNTGNSVFGKPPVCELRLGDYLNTKMLIQNISFQYDPLIWDTNPEGIGMQPMLCNVSMSCIIIGGSSIEGAVSELQNALTYNYYANTKTYRK